MYRWQSFSWEDLRDDEEIQIEGNGSGNQYSLRERTLVTPRQTKCSMIGRVIMLSSLILAVVLIIVVSVSVVNSPTRVRGRDHKLEGETANTTVVPQFHFASPSVAPKPTVGPTPPSPHSAATGNHTLLPSSHPTYDPALRSTLNPAVRPSARPTLNPTLNPTFDPSSPTLDPSSVTLDQNSTTLVPSSATLVPSSATLVPSSVTLVPSSATLVPSSATLDPSSVPTMILTEIPSTSPTEPTTGLPSVSPTASYEHIQHSNETAIASFHEKAPPAPTKAPLRCFDTPGYFHNHAGNKVLCKWLQSVTPHMHSLNCGDTEIGKACSLSCANYVDCILPPTMTPTAFPISELPTLSPVTGVPTRKPLGSATVPVSDDATIQKSQPNANFGTAAWLKVDHGSERFNALLRFNLTEYDTTRLIKSAALRLRASADCPAGGYIKNTQHSDWNEMSVTWDTAPDGYGIALAVLDGIRAGYWYSMDVTSAVLPGKNAVSFRMFPAFPASTKECLYSSKEEAIANAAELHIVYA